MKTEQTIEQDAELFSNKRKALDPVYSMGLYYGYIEGAERQQERTNTNILEEFIQEINQVVEYNKSNPGVPTLLPNQIFVINEIIKMAETKISKINATD